MVAKADLTRITWGGSKGGREGKGELWRKGGRKEGRGEEGGKGN